MIVLLAAGGFTITLMSQKLYTSKAEAQHYGGTITTAIDRLDSTVHELVIENRVKERIIHSKEAEAALLDSAYREVRQLNEMLQSKHYATLNQLKRTRKQLDESVRNQRITVPAKPLDRLAPGDSSALPSIR